MFVIAPCLLSPYLVYRGAKEKELAAAAAVRKLISGYEELGVLTYPCPEFILLGFPRAPATREVYERLGMREVAGRVAAFIERVIAEERPTRVILVGVKGSPTCAAFVTSSSSPEEYPYQRLEEFGNLNKDERLVLAKEIARDFSLVARPGILFELLREKVKGTYIDFDKDNVPESTGALEAALEGASALGGET